MFKIFVFRFLLFYLFFSLPIFDVESINKNINKNHLNSLLLKFNNNFSDSISQLLNIILKESNNDLNSFKELLYNNIKNPSNNDLNSFKELLYNNIKSLSNNDIGIILLLLITSKNIPVIKILIDNKEIDFNKVNICIDGCNIPFLTFLIGRIVTNDNSNIVEMLEDLLKYLLEKRADSLLFNSMVAIDGFRISPLYIAILYFSHNPNILKILSRYSEMIDLEGIYFIDSNCSNYSGIYLLLKRLFFVDSKISIEDRIDILKKFIQNRNYDINTKFYVPDFYSDELVDYSNKYMISIEIVLAAIASECNSNPVLDNNDKLKLFKVLFESYNKSNLSSNNILLILDRIFFLCLNFNNNFVFGLLKIFIDHLFDNHYNKDILDCLFFKSLYFYIKYNNSFQLDFFKKIRSFLLDKFKNNNINPPKYISDNDNLEYDSLIFSMAFNKQNIKKYLLSNYNFYNLSYKFGGLSILNYSLIYKEKDIFNIFIKKLLIQESYLHILQSLIWVNILANDIISYKKSNKIDNLSCFTIFNLLLNCLCSKEYISLKDQPNVKSIVDYLNKLNKVNKRFLFNNELVDFFKNYNNEIKNIKHIIAIDIFLVILKLNGDQKELIKSFKNNILNNIDFFKKYDIQKYDITIEKDINKIKNQLNSSYKIYPLLTYLAFKLDKNIADLYINILFEKFDVHPKLFSFYLKKFVSDFKNLSNDFYDNNFYDYFNDKYNNYNAKYIEYNDQSNTKDNIDIIINSVINNLDKDYKKEFIKDQIINFFNYYQNIKDIKNIAISILLAILKLDGNKDELIKLFKKNVLNNIEFFKKLNILKYHNIVIEKDINKIKYQLVSCKSIYPLLVYLAFKLDKDIAQLYLDILFQKNDNYQFFYIPKSIIDYMHDFTNNCKELSNLFDDQTFYDYFIKYKVNSIIKYMDNLDEIYKRKFINNQLINFFNYYNDERKDIKQMIAINLLLAILKLDGNKDELIKLFKNNVVNNIKFFKEIDISNYNNMVIEKDINRIKHQLISCKSICPFLVYLAFKLDKSISDLYIDALIELYSVKSIIFNVYKEKLLDYCQKLNDKEFRIYFNDKINSKYDQYNALGSSKNIKFTINDGNIDLIDLDNSLNNSFDIKESYL